MGFQESLDQNNYYKNLFDNDLIDKNTRSLKFIENIEKKIQIIKNTKKIYVENPDLKENIIYHNYTFFPISNYENFFNFIRKEFEYVLIEESQPPYLSDTKIQKKIRDYVKSNFKLISSHKNQNKIFLRYQQSVLHYFSNTLTKIDISKDYHDYDREADVVYGSNFGLYKLN